MSKLNEELVDTMSTYGLTRPKVAKLCMCSVSAVDKWLRPEGTPNYANMPAHRFRLLVLGIQQEGLKPKEAP